MAPHLDRHLCIHPLSTDHYYQATARLKVVPVQRNWWVESKLNYTEHNLEAL